MPREVSRYIVMAIMMIAGFGFLTACATKPTPYGPAEANRGYGYSEQQIEQNRFRINFKGSPATTRDQIDNYLLLRAAELAKANGFDSFILTNRQVEVAKRSNSPRFSIGGMGFGGGGSSAVGGGAGITFGGGGQGSLYDTFADVVMFKGPKPSGDIHAYSADEVLARLQGAIKPASGQ